QSLVDSWLSGVLLAKDLATAWAQRHRLQPGQVYVVAQGHQVDRHGVYFYAADAPHHQLLNRQQEIEDLTEQTNVSKAALADLQSQSALLDSTIDRLAHALEKGQQQRSAMGADVHHYDLQATMLAQKRQEAQRQEQSLVSRNQALTTEQAQLTEQQMQAAAKVERLSELLETAQQHLDCQGHEV